MLRLVRTIRIVSMASTTPCPCGPSALRVPLGVPAALVAVTINIPNQPPSPVGVGPVEVRPLARKLLFSVRTSRTDRLTRLVPRSVNRCRVRSNRRLTSSMLRQPLTLDLQCLIMAPQEPRVTLAVRRRVLTRWLTLCNRPTALSILLRVSIRSPPHRVIVRLQLVLCVLRPVCRCLLLKTGIERAGVTPKK